MSWALHLLGELRRNRRTKLKKKCYLPNALKEEVIGKILRWADEQDYAALVDYWFLPSTKTLIDKNKRSRGFQKDIARSGPISFAQTADKMAKESGQAVERATLFAKVYSTKDGAPVSTAVKEKIDKMTAILNNGCTLHGERRDGILWAKDDAFAQVIGAERSGRSEQRHKEEIAEALAEAKRQSDAQHKEQLAEAKRQFDAQHRVQMEEMMSSMKAALDHLSPGVSQLCRDKVLSSLLKKMKLLSILCVMKRYEMGSFGYGEMRLIDFSKFCCKVGICELPFHSRRSWWNPNCIILAISPANQDIATSDAIKLAREVDPSGERTFGVLTKLDLMDKGTNALDVIEGRSYRLQHPWVGIVNRSQADINKNVDMIVARCKEWEYFATSPEYGHLASKMGSEYLAKLLSKHLESVIGARIPSITSLINKSIEELESEMDHLGRPIAVDAGAQLYTILELCRAFDRIFNEHLEGGSCIVGSLCFERTVRKSIAETQELKHFPTLQAEIAAAGGEALERFREESKKTVIRLVDMESSYLTVDFFRRLPQEVEKAGNPAGPAGTPIDRYIEGHFRRIGSNVSSYVGMVSETLKNTILKAVVYCQVKEAKQSLLNHFYIQIGKREAKQLVESLDEDPALMERRQQCAKRLELKSLLSSL
ncbi:hypothetical protein SO802_032846 [Lithocarpus litseifolius]|uniref:GED domain-containing protein n=1 Tax=Lithocarpus litseifolius TaxID=425828 RepID=A0AAW2BDE5_9ROSI